MKVRVTATKILDSLWGTEEEFAELSDKEIIEIVYEGLPAFVDEAEWKVERVA